MPCSEKRARLLLKRGRARVARRYPFTIRLIDRGSSNRISNLTLACAACNDAKGALPIEVFLADKPEKLQRILAEAKRPLNDAAAARSEERRVGKEC